ncbi:MAG: DUF455 family protein [Polyangiaceae bacterium]
MTANESQPEVAPPAGTVERWAWDHVLGVDLEAKLCPPPPPRVWESAPPVRRLARPGRPRELVVAPHASKTPGPEALRSPARRAQLVHTFLHHELQAAELMAWALLAFPETPRAFRGGLVHIALDEVRHIRMYREHLAELGHRFGDFPVRDWFWERVPEAPTAAHFVAVMGVGFEGANLDHTARFAERFRAAGDERGARLQEVVGAEEVPHVRFAMRWLRRFTRGASGAIAAGDGGGSRDASGARDAGGVRDARGAGVDFSLWVRHLPPPLSPILMRGKPLDRERRRQSGFSEPFLAELVAWSERPPGS